jgi:hypothetical protein
MASTTEPCSRVLRLYFKEKSFQLIVSPSISPGGIFGLIKELTGVDVHAQRVVLDNKMVLSERVNVSIIDLNAYLSASNTHRRAVLLQVVNEYETDAHKLPILNALKRMTQTQDEQLLALATMSQAMNMENMSQMLGRLRSNAQSVLQYEDETLQTQALATIPVVELYERAMASENPRPSFSDELLKQLLKWFKHEFFSWTNQPPCQNCSGATTFQGGGHPNEEERAGQAGRVEVYKCNACGTITRFPRYNHPGKLLQTRTGRCGEWANCFTLCCRSLNFDARLANDWTDHVWTEVYSEFLGRWLHCDSCENVMDAPLMYESGWGKKLTYVIGCSRDEVVDVTWRYTDKREEVLERRNMVSEIWLENAIRALNRQQRVGRQFLSSTRCKHMEMRKAVELNQLRDGPRALDRDKEAENCGRVSGSVAWRNARSELGVGTARERALHAGGGDLTHPTSASSAGVTAFVKRVVVRAGMLVDKISFFAADNTCICACGEDGGSEQEPFVMAEDEFLKRIVQRGGDSLDSLTFFTNLGRSKTYGGDGGSVTTSFEAKDGEMITKVHRATGLFCPLIDGIACSPVPTSSRKSEDTEDSGITGSGQSEGADESKQAAE